MEWQDQAMIMGLRRHGEQGAIATLLTEQHGLYTGMIRSINSHQARSIHQMGAWVQVSWRARLAEQLGTFQCELLSPLSSLLLGEPMKLAALSSLCSLVIKVMPEREPCQELFEAMLVLAQHLVQGKPWRRHYLDMELMLLNHTGFGLDLSACALTGKKGELAYASPQTGRCVVAEAGEPYKAKLIPVPLCLNTPGQEPEPEEFVQGVKLLQYFLERALQGMHLHGNSQGLPQARLQFAEHLAINI